MQIICEHVIFLGFCLNLYKMVFYVSKARSKLQYTEQVFNRLSTEVANIREVGNMKTFLLFT